MAELKNKEHFEFVTNYENIINLKNKVLKYTEEDWNKYDYRQKTFDPHRFTKTLPLIWNELNKDSKRNLEKNGRKFWPEEEKYREDLDAFTKIFENHYGPGFIATAMFINLPAKKIIEPHVDSYDPFFAKCHRNHLAIITHEDVIFQIEHEERNIREGELFQINNNTCQHMVKNGSLIDRVHLLMDWLPTS
jgi:hypothetical protein